jgi:hypothetical protein
VQDGGSDPHTRRRSACVLRVRILLDHPPSTPGSSDCMVPRGRDLPFQVWARRCHPLGGLHAPGRCPRCQPRRGRHPPGQRRVILRQGHGHPLKQVQHQLSGEQGRCPAASHRRLNLGTTHRVTVAIPIAAMTALQRQSSRGGYAPAARPGASNNQVNLKFHIHKNVFGSCPSRELLN